MAYLKRNGFFVSVLLAASIMSGCSGGSNGVGQSSALTPQTSTSFMVQSVAQSSIQSTDTLIDGSFSTPSLNGGYQYAPANPGPWQYVALNSDGGPGGSGITANGTAFTSANPAAPTPQVAFMQGDSTLTQSINLPAGIYTFSTLAAARNGYGGGNPIRVSVDGVVGGTITPTSISYRPYSVTVVWPTSGVHNLDLQGLDLSINNTTFLTSMTLNKAAGTATPPPSTLQQVGVAYPSGETPNIPAKIEFSNYNYGGEGIAYHTQHATNLGGQYRSDGVGIQQSTVTGGNGLNLGWANPGDWYDYSFNVPKPGIYYVQFATASYLPVNTPAGEIKIEQVNSSSINDDVTYYNPITVVGTGGWQNWKTTTPVGVQFSTAGSHVFRINLLAYQSEPYLPAQPFGVNLAYMTISSSPQANPTPSGQPTPKPTPTPGPVLVQDAEFESPNIGSGQQILSPTNTAWTFSQKTIGSYAEAGIASTGAETYAHFTKAQGSQVAFIDFGGSLSQRVSGFQSGVAYRVYFAQALGPKLDFGLQDGVTVLIDGTTIANIVGQYSQADPWGFQTYGTPVFTPGAGSHTVTFRGYGNDEQVLLDNISIIPAR